MKSRTRILMAVTALSLSPAILPAQDLWVHNLKVTPDRFREGDSVRATYTVTNRSDTATKDFVVRVSITRIFQRSVTIKNATRKGLGGKQKVDVTLDFKAPSGLDGWCDFKVHADPFQKIPDTNRRNNSVEETVLLRANKPDLKAASIRPENNQVRAGQTHRTLVVVENAGFKDSVASSVGFYISDDAEITTKDRRIATYQVPALQIGKTHIVWRNPVVPEDLMSGPCWIGIIVDPDDDLEEESDHNNALGIQQTTRIATARPKHAVHFRRGKLAALPGLSSSVASAGDVNADGFDDVIAGAPGPATVGSAVVYSGKDGATLYTLQGRTVGSEFGFSVSTAGDANGDGFADFVIGAPGENSRRGVVYIYSGRTGKVLFRKLGESYQGRLGHCVASAGDVNDDGYDDTLAGAPKDDGRGSDSGSVTVFSGRNGSILRVFHGTKDSDFGAAVAGIGDVDGDEHDDIVVGAPASSGRAFIISGRTGVTLRTVTSSESGTGAAVAGGGDADGDGTPDILVGSPGSYDSEVLVISGRTRRTLRSHESDVKRVSFGASVCFVGDADGDGRDDYAVGSPATDYGQWQDCGQVRVFSGRTGLTILSRMGGANNARFGASISGYDGNDDGVADLVAGAPGAASNLGQLTVFRSSGKVVGRSRPYGSGCRSAFLRLPRNVVRGNANVGKRMRMRLESAPGFSVALLQLGTKRTSLSLGSVGAQGCRLLTSSLLSFTGTTDRDGTTSVPFDLPNDAKLVGFTMLTQWWIFDRASNQLGMIGSNGQQVVVGKL